MAASMTVIGQRELQRILDALPGKVRRKVVRRAVNMAATPVVRAVKARATKQSGTLKKSIRKKVKLYEGTAIALVGASSAVSGEHAGRKRKPVYYSHLVEGGFDWKPNRRQKGHESNRKQRRSTSGRRVTGRPFMKPAFFASQAQAMTILEKELAAGVVKEAKRR
jgi:hypothetical protein